MFTFSRKHKHITRIGLLPALVMIVMSAGAQFYNGSQLEFGKNRVQYREFLWSYYNFDNFDVYFYRNGKDLAVYTAKYASEQIPLIEQQLDASLDDKVQFLVFNNLSDLKQSNLGLMNKENYNTGGITYIIGRKIFLYFNGTYTDFEKQIRAGISKLVFNEMMFGGSVGSQIKNSALYNLPDWYQKGFISYMSDHWNADIDNLVKDYVLFGKYKNFNSLTGEKAVYAGHSLWKFIADNFGEKAVPNVVQMTRITRSVENGFLYVLGLSFKNLVKEWFEYYRNYYAFDSESGENLPEDPLLKRYKKDRVYTQVKIDPQGRYAAYVTNEIGLCKIYIYDIIQAKKKRIARMGYRLEEKNDYLYPMLAWHPSGKILAYMALKKGDIYVYFYDLEKKSKSRMLLYSFERINSFSYSPDGRKLIMSAVQKGQSDIYVFNIGSGSHERVTSDIWDDLQPRFIDGESRIVFSSNRVSDSLKDKPGNISVNLPDQYDIWVYNYRKKEKTLRRVTNTPFANERQPMPYEDGFITFLSDENGIYNRYLASFDSAIAYVDTVTHYRYFSEYFPVTNYSRNILQQDVSAKAGKIAEVLYYEQRFRVYTEEMLPPDMLSIPELKNTSYVNDLEAGEIEQEESIEQSGKKKRAKARKRFYNVYEGDVIVMDKSEKINIDEYVFDKQSFVKLGYDSTEIVFDEEGEKKFNIPKRRLYRVEYFLNELTTQIDFSFLNSTYQPFSGGGQPIFLNPGFNALFKIGLTDLLEDHRIVGGVRLNVNLINNEYLVSYSNLKKRVDKEIVFHRVTVEDVGTYSIKRNHSHEVYYVLSYPFNPVLAFKTTAMYRNDARVYLSTDQFNLKRKTEYRNWLSLKGELVFDNTRSLGLNLFKGTRYKIFGEYYQMVDERDQDLIVLGFDFRKYIKIHRTLIWANRFAGSTSFGNNKLIYYMGGVDNWLVPKFDQGTPIDYSQNYAYQTLATNMRGFDQNIRNGNNFVLINTEIRLPVFRYFFNRPIKSDFLNNFQAVTFADAGTAWTGWNPYSSDNSLFTRRIRNGSLYIEVQEQRDPIVAGFGWGLRTRLLGYFLRGDMAWGIEDGYVNKKPIIYVSLSLDF